MTLKAIRRGMTAADTMEADIIAAAVIAEPDAMSHPGVGIHMAKPCRQRKTDTPGTGEELLCRAFFLNFLTVL